MRIPSRVYTDAAGQIAGRPDRVTAPEEPAEAQSIRGEEDVRVAVSGEARKLAVASGMDADKVARLRAAIEAGTFTVDVTRVAESLVETGG
ncbi:MAG: flagellar biosynthesis anti-sigma factor FlgM [Myxococcota bacterium]